MTVALYMGMNNILSVRFPSPAKVEILSTNEETEQQVRQIINDEAEKGKTELEKSLKKIGENVVYGKRGDSPHFFSRKK